MPIYEKLVEVNVPVLDLFDVRIYPPFKALYQSLAGFQLRPFVVTCGARQLVKLLKSVVKWESRS